MSTNDIAAPLEIPNCGFSCPLKKMYELYSSSMPTINIADDCRITATTHLFDNKDNTIQGNLSD